LAAEDFTKSVKKKPGQHQKYISTAPLPIIRKRDFDKAWKDVLKLKILERGKSSVYQAA